MLGIPDRIVEHGTLKELHRECGYDAQAISDAVRIIIKEKHSILPSQDKNASQICLQQY